MVNNNIRNEEPDWNTDEEGSSEEESSEGDGSQEDSSEEVSESEDDTGSDETNSSEDDDDDGSSDGSKSDDDNDNESNSENESNSDIDSDSDSDSDSDGDSDSGSGSGSGSGDDGDGSVFRDEEEKGGRGMAGGMSSGSLMNEAGQSTTWMNCVPACIVGMGMTAAALFCCCIIFIPLLAIVIGLSVGLSGDEEIIPTVDESTDIFTDMKDVELPLLTFQPTKAPTQLVPGPSLQPDTQLVPGPPLQPEVTLLSVADTTIYRNGLLQSSAYGDEMTMLVQNGPPGDPEIASAYSLVQFDGIQGIDSDTMSIDAYLSNIDDLTVQLCLTRAVSDNDSGTNDDGTSTVTYSTCLLPSADTATDIETLTGDTALEYIIPESCVNGEVTTFEIGPSTENLCIDVTSLFGKTSSTSNSDLSTNSTALRGLRRRFLQEDNVNANETTPTTTTTPTSSLFMIDTLKESDKPGDRFYTRADINGRQPSLKIIGKSACKNTVDIACTEPQFSTLCSLIGKSDLSKILDSPDAKNTVFAPTNDAFDRLSPGTLEALNDIDVLVDVLQYHITSGKLMSEDLECGLAIEMANSRTTTTLCGNNGVFYQVGGGVTPGLPEIIDADMETCNGVIHVIDEVLVPDGGNITCISNETKSIADIACTDPNFAAFCGLVRQAGISDILAGGNFTVFAPSNAAFQVALESLGQSVDMKDKGVITNVLLQHIVWGSAVNSEDLTCNMTVLMGNDENNTITCKDGAFFVGGPGNDKNAFPGIVSADLDACNGLIHMIDGVIIPEIDVANNTVGNVVDIPNTAINAGSFNTLVAALGAADLVETVSDPNGPFTVFAPTDDAFASLPERLVPCLLEENNKSVLSNILLYHVADSKVLSTDLSDGQQIPTKFADGKVTVDLSDGGVKINNSTVIVPDVLASNGVIHVIDQVLVPSSIDVTAFLETCSDDETTDEVEV